jgi:hypothetical protein
VSVAELARVIDEPGAQTMRYVHHAETHRRAIPAEILAAGATMSDPDERVLAVLGARSGARQEASASRPTSVAQAWPRTAPKAEKPGVAGPFAVAGAGFEVARPPWKSRG